MEIKGKVHCLFEQSGTFKNEFIKLGIPAEDYDLQNNFGQTDHVVDLFGEIDRAFDCGASIFDDMKADDLVIAFFPCIMFCGISQMNMTLECFRKNNGRITGAGEYIINQTRKRQAFLELLLKMCFVCIDRGFRLVLENPYSSNTFLRSNFIKPPDIVDNNRQKRGDYFVKQTGYWFFNCEPTRCETVQMVKEHHKKYFLVHSEVRKIHPGIKFAKESKVSGMCSEERSMISPDYARNFIADFILGKPCGGQPQQQELF